MRPLNILVCGNNRSTLLRLARNLADEGVRVRISDQIVHDLCCSGQDWDILMVDLDGLNGFLRSVLVGLRRRFPDLPLIGVSSQPGPKGGHLNENDGLALDVDARFDEIPRPEELLVHFPQLAAKYLSA